MALLSLASLTASFFVPQQSLPSALMTQGAVKSSHQVLGKSSGTFHRLVMTLLAPAILQRRCRLAMAARSRNLPQAGVTSRKASSQFDRSRDASSSAAQNADIEDPRHHRRSLHCQ